METPKNGFGYYAKSFVAAGVAFAGGMATAYTDNELSTAEIWTVVAATVVALGAVWGVPNTPDKRL